MSVTEPLVQASLIGEGLENGPVLVLVADEHMRLAAVNARACDELGYAREELVGMPFDAVFLATRDAGVAVLTRKDGTRLRLRHRTDETTIAGMPFHISVGWPE